MPSSQSKKDDLIVPKTPAEISFVKGLIARGEAAARSNDGSIQPGVTFEIVGKTESGLPIVRRLRFAGIA